MKIQRAWLACAGIGIFAAAAFLQCHPASGDAGESELTVEQLQTVEELEAIGYLRGSEPATDKRGVTLHDPERASSGVNLFTSGHAPEAVLIDMNGKLLHRWHCEFRDVWPDRPVSPYVYFDMVGNVSSWRNVHLYENGDLLAIFEGQGLIKLDKDSNLLWASPLYAHHDMDVLDNGDIWVLTRKAHMIPRIDAETPVLEDFVTIFDAQGKEKETYSLLEAYERSDRADELPDDLASRTDLLHTNTLERLDGSMAHLSPLYREGNILTSFRALDTIAIVEGSTHEVVWTLKGDWAGQHCPTLLPNGNILLFDNNRWSDNSRVLELDPVSGEPIWTYQGTPPSSFFTQCCGLAEKLPNGNVLITESQAGRAFEVIRDGTVVWEFFNPNRVGERKEKAAYLYVMKRFPENYCRQWLSL